MLLQDYTDAWRWPELRKIYTVESNSADHDEDWKARRALSTGEDARAATEAFFEARASSPVLTSGFYGVKFNLNRDQPATIAFTSHPAPIAPLRLAAEIIR